MSGFADKKGIAVASGFKLQAEALLDARGQVDTIEERDALVTLHAATAGLQVYVKANKTMYVYNGSGWDELSKGAAYTHPTGAGNKHIPAGGSAGQILRWSADGTATWGNDNNTTYAPFKGATADAAGGTGLVPAPAASAANKYLRNDGTWQTPPNTTYSPATASAPGLMSAADKAKLDGVATGANKTVVDTALSDTSGNPVQNKVVKSALDGKVPTSRKVNNKALSADITLAAGDVGAIPVSQKGAAGGVAELDSSGKVPAAQLPGYVDDVIEGYLSGSKLYKESAHTTEITGESGKIYVDLHTNKTYRWSGTAFVVISDTIALGETSSTAYRGDRGKIAYEHSQTAHAPANAEQNVQSDWNVTDTASDAYIKNKPTSLPANGGNAATVGGHTVGVDVPANAVFTDTKPVNMKGATASAAGAAGYAPAPAAGAQDKFLRGDGTWQTPPNTTYTKATSSKDGLMSKEDKQKLDEMPQIYFASEFPESAPAGSVCFLIS